MECQTRGVAGNSVDIESTVAAQSHHGHECDPLSTEVLVDFSLRTDPKVEFHASLRRIALAHLQAPGWEAFQSYDRNIGFGNGGSI